MNDEQIVGLYFARDEQALVQTQKKYGGYCFALANSILHSKLDAEETVNDTYLKAWNAIPPHRPVALKLFLAKITRNLAFSRWWGMTAQKRGGGELELALEELEECLTAPEQVEDVLRGKELAQTIRCFLDTLSSREQNIFLRRYFFLEESSVIAQRYGMSSTAVLRSLSRSRGKLKNYLRQEGYCL